MTGMDETEEAQRARAAKADLAEILERRPDLKGISIELIRRILPETRPSPRFYESSKHKNEFVCTGG